MLVSLVDEMITGISVGDSTLRVDSADSQYDFQVASGDAETWINSVINPSGVVGAKVIRVQNFVPADQYALEHISQIFTDNGQFCVVSVRTAGDHVPLITLTDSQETLTDLSSQNTWFASYGD